jgi:hypothetical protein
MRYMALPPKKEKPTLFSLSLQDSNSNPLFYIDFLDFLALFPSGKCIRERETAKTMTQEQEQEQRKGIGEGYQHRDRCFHTKIRKEDNQKGTSTTVSYDGMIGRIRWDEIVEHIRTTHGHIG